MESTTLRDHMDYLIQCTEKLQLSKKISDRYKQRYETIFEYCCANGLESFTSSDLEGFLAIQCAGQKAYFIAATRKIAYVVASYFKNGEFCWKHTFQPHYPVSAENADLLDAFKLKLLEHLSPGTVRTSVGIVQHFLNDYESSGVYDVSCLTDEVILGFVRKEAPHNKQSIAKLVRTMRKFVAFLREKDIVDLTADRFLTETGRCRTKSLPCFTEEEVNAIFSVIDRSTDKGRRDYAIFLLALRTGLRASDISRLKLEDIDWKKNCIRVVQKKTKVALELPVPIDAGNAIADYILNVRYDSENPYIFLRIKKNPCLEPINPTGFNTYLRQLLKDAGISKEGWDGKSFHAFRRTAGTRMLMEGTPVTTVAQVLGHGSMESSKRYIALDTQKLKECGLSLGALRTRKEGIE